MRLTKTDGVSKPVGDWDRTARLDVNADIGRFARIRPRLTVALLVVVLLTFGMTGVGEASPGLSVSDLNHGVTATDLASALAGAGVTISNITYTGAPNAAGEFTGGDGGSLIGFDSGIVMGSGSVQTTATSTTCDKGVEGPNQCDENTTVNFTPGDTDLTTLSGKPTFDAAVLEFDFVPQFSTVQFSYVFSSDEYNEFSNTAFNDTFAFLVNGTNCAVVPGTSTPVGVNTINGGNPLGTNAQNPSFYRNNDLDDGGGAIDTEMDGLTVVLTCNANVNAGQTNHMKLAISDASDTILDSNVFIQAGSLVSLKSTSTTYTGGTSVQYSDPVTLSGTLLDTSVSPTVGIAGNQLDFTLGTQTASASQTDASGNASTSLTVLQKPGSATSVATSFAGDSTYAASNDTDPFSIAKEDCTLAYSGDILVPPATMTSLAADLGEPDASLGDRSGKTVTFTVVDAALNTQTFTASTDSSGHASTSVALPDGVYGVSVSFAGDDFYLPCATATDTLVTVAAAAAKVTGGGWIAIGTGRTSFGFNAIPIAGGGFKGQFQLRSNNGKSRFHGNVISNLSGSGNTATWSGTGRWNGQLGYTYTISVVDNGSSGSKKGDTISITITSPSNVVVYSTGGPQALKGGNITVH